MLIGLRHRLRGIRTEWRQKPVVRLSDMLNLAIREKRIPNRGFNTTKTESFSIQSVPMQNALGGDGQGRFGDRDDQRVITSVGLHVQAFYQKGHLISRFFNHLGCGLAGTMARSGFDTNQDGLRTRLAFL